MAALLEPEALKELGNAPTSAQVVKFLHLTELKREEEQDEEKSALVANGKFVQHLMDPRALKRMQQPAEVHFVLTQQLTAYLRQSRGDAFSRFNEPILFVNTDLILKVLLNQHVKYTLDRNPTVEKIAELCPEMAEELLSIWHEFQEDKLEFDECCLTSAVTVDYLRGEPELIERLNRKLTEDFFWHVGAKDLLNPLMREPQLLDYFKKTLPLFNSVSTFFRYKFSSSIPVRLFHAINSDF